MTPGTFDGRASAPVFERAAAFAARRPEWWIIAACAGAWLILVATSPVFVPQEAAHAHAAASRNLAAVWHWELMVAAMMLPLAIEAVRKAAVWQHTGIKRRALAACHRTIPLAPRGLQADCHCFAFGWRIGGSCLESCWILMAACVFAGHGLFVMVVSAAIGAVERFSWRRSAWASSVSIGGMALICGITAYAV